MEIVLLFFGAFLDATIGPNLFVPGEPFLIAAGYKLQEGVIAGVFAVLLGGWLGDQLSYFIGLRSGYNMRIKLMRFTPKIISPLARCRLMMRRKGNFILLFARLLGPVAWVVPFMAGSTSMKWGHFTLYSSIGLILGVGQFIIIGYFLAAGIDLWSNNF